MYGYRTSKGFTPLDTMKHIKYFKEAMLRMNIFFINTFIKNCVQPLIEYNLPPPLTDPYMGHEIYVL